MTGHSFDPFRKEQSLPLLFPPKTHQRCPFFSKLLAASHDAIDYARQRLANGDLTADLTVGNFTSLPYAADSFDLVFDRTALTHCGFSYAKRAVCEIYRVLVPGGKIFSNLFSSSHSTVQSGCLRTILL
jgi:ubiquinone/menaquinone biosynthesis C-methylase UbiE